MKKQDYENQLADLKGRRKAISDRIEEIRKDYISSNQPFKIGDRLKTTHGEFGIVYGFDLDWDGNVKPLMKKEKKDGNASKHELNIYKAEQVSLADNF